MKKYKPSKVNKRRRTVDSCSHGDCDDHIIWDYQTCWKHLSNTEKNKLKDRLTKELREKSGIPEIILSGCDLRKFDFSGMDMSKAWFDRCNLEGANFEDTKLQRAFLAKANLTSANLTRCELDGTVFSGTCIHDVELLAYSISFGKEPINISKESFQEKWGKGKAKINEKESYFAEATYRALKTYFQKNGQYDDESWAAFKERTMQRKELWNRKNYLGWFNSSVFNLSCGYGEKPSRVFLFSLFLILIFAIVYKQFNLIEELSGDNIISWVDSISYSFASFCTISLPKLIANAQPITRLLTGIEAFLGIFATGLFIFSLTKKYAAR